MQIIVGGVTIFEGDCQEYEALACEPTRDRPRGGTEFKITLFREGPNVFANSPNPPLPSSNRIQIEGDPKAIEIPSANAPKVVESTADKLASLARGAVLSALVAASAAAYDAHQRGEFEFDRAFLILIAGVALNAAKKFILDRYK